MLRRPPIVTLKMRFTLNLRTRMESAERGSGYFTTHADTHPGVKARTAGVYWRADPEDMSIMDGRDDRKRAELIAERLRHWKSIKNA